MSSMQPTTSKTSKKNDVPRKSNPNLRYECLHLKEVNQVKATLGQLKTDYGDILIKTSNLIKKLTDLEERVKKLEVKTTS